jgi:hypothetical protein
VQVVEVHVRDQHRVDAAEDVAVERHVSPQVRHPWRQDRIGEKPNVTELEQDGRVPDPRQLTV